MPRIRSVHPGLWTDDAFVSCSPLARLLHIGLWTEADDGGAFSWNPLKLRMRLLPGDNLDLDQLLDELVRADLIRRYEVDSRPYGAVRNFGQFQRPKKPTRTHPMPPDLRTYAASTALSSEPRPPKGTDPGQLDLPESDAVPPSGDSGSPLVGESLRRDSRKERKKDSTADAVASADAAAPAPEAISHEIWTKGLARYRQLTGRSQSASRRRIGQLLRDARDDPEPVMQALQDCPASGDADAWITAAVRAKGYRNGFLSIIASEGMPSMTEPEPNAVGKFLAGFADAAR
jgi:hypothetical protein